MGIPHLRKRLNQYGRRKRWQAGTTADAPSLTIIVDGPAFAHHIYTRLQHELVSGLSPSFDAIPTYERIVEEALKYLNDLEEVGLKIRKIYFDGFLPNEKKQTRLERTSRAFSVLQQFNHAFPSILEQKGHEFGSSVASRSFLERPKPPFLVPALLDALHSSHFAHLTETVAMEADAACTRSSTVHDMILTNDTDLIVYHPAGKVAFFNDCFLTSILDEDETSAIKSFDCTMFDTSEMLQLLGSDDMIKIAFFMLGDAHRSLHESAQLAREYVMNANEAEEFKSLEDIYIHRMLCSNFPRNQDAHDCKAQLTSLLRSLDPRISELVHQALSTQDDALQPIEMHLPTLIDDASLPSAWTASLYIRLVVYRALRLVSRQTKSYKERDRLSSRSLVVDADRSKDLHSAQKGLFMIHMYLRDYLRDTQGDAPAWRAVCAILALKLSSDDGCTPPTLPVLETAIGTREGDWTWTHAHLSATIEAVMYSLRMLKQVLPIFLAIHRPEGHLLRDEFSDLARHVSGVLDDMPSLPDLLVKPSWHLPMGEYHRPVLMVLPPLAPSSTEEKNTSRRREKRGDEDASSKALRKSGPKHGGAAADANLFDVLSSDDAT